MRLFRRFAAIGCLVCALLAGGCMPKHSARPALAEIPVPQQNPSRPMVPMTSIAPGYGRSLLPEAQQQIYDTVCAAAEGGQIDMPLPLKAAVSKEIFTEVFAAVKNDRPEFYWLEWGEAQSADTSGRAYILHIAAPLTWESVLLRQKQLEEAAAQLLSDLPADEAEQAILLHDRVLKQIEYGNGNAKTAGNVYEGIVDGFGNCGAYARSYQYLLNSAGIPNIYVEGMSTRRVLHAWNMLALQGEWYCADTTWDDILNEKGYLCHDYLLITSGQMQQDHIEKIGQYAFLPRAMGTDYNFYRLRGWYATYDADVPYEKALASGFLRALCAQQLTEDSATYVLEIRVFAAPEAFEEWRKSYCRDIFAVLREMKKQIAAQSLPIALEDTGQVTYHFSNNTQVLTLFVTAKLHESSS